MTNPLNTPQNAHVCKPALNKGLLAALCFTALEGGLLLMPAAVQALELDYQHQYNEKERDHTDKVMITQALDNGLAFSFQFVASPAEKSNGQPGQPFEHMTKDSLKGKVKYSHKLTKHLKFKPTLSPRTLKWRTSTSTKTRTSVRPAIAWASNTNSDRVPPFKPCWRL